MSTVTITSKDINTLGIKQKKEILDLYKHCSSQMSTEIFDILTVSKKYNITPESLESFIIEKNNILYNKNTVSDEDRPKNQEDGERPISVVHVEGPKPMSKEDMIKTYKIDTSQYAISKIKHNQRPTSMHRKDGKIAQIMNHQTTIELKNLIPQETEHITEAIKRIIKQQPPSYEPKTYTNPPGNLGQIFLADAHIDRLDTKYTTPKRKQKALKEGTYRLLDKMDKFSPEQLIFVNLGDFWDSAINNQTEKGTPQQKTMYEIDSRKYGIETQQELLLILSEYGPVIAKFLQGNHDGEKVAHLQSVMGRMFQNNDNITIDTDTELHQFFDRGINKFGYDHGHRGKDKNLPKLLTHNKHKKQKNLEWFRGHLHHRAIKDIEGVLIHTLNSCSEDSQREKNSTYRGQGPTLSGFIHHKKEGKIAEINQKVK